MMKEIGFVVKTKITIRTNICLQSDIYFLSYNYFNQQGRSNGDHDSRIHDSEDIQRRCKFFNYQVLNT